LQLLAEGLEAAGANTEIPDRRLALMFACALPAIDAGIRAPLMLQGSPPRIAASQLHSVKAGERLPGAHLHLSDHLRFQAHRPPGFSRWYLSFNLERAKQQRVLNTTDFSRVVVQFLPNSAASKKAETETPHD
jgi:hypothetical protein